MEFREFHICAACGEPFDWAGLSVGGEEYCCAECASGKPCGCPAHAHGLPGRDTDDPGLVILDEALSHPAQSNGSYHWSGRD